MEISNYTSRKYKGAKPTETINKIRSLFGKIDYFVYEVKWFKANDEIYSIRVMSDFKDGHFGTNGKGRSKEFALASAYAEHIERIQNQMLGGTTSFSRLILNKIKTESNCFYYPDETYITKESFYKLPPAFFNDLKLVCSKDLFIESYFERLAENKYEGVLGVPFYDVKNNKIINLPYGMIQMICGSNGMAAGNTPEEAIFQGLCELLERYCASQIYFKQLTPPTIPDVFLKKFPAEYNLIQKIKKETGFQIIVKDFSAKTNFPVLGVLFIDNDKKKYRLNVGTETCFPVALSRCLTEIYQGLTKENITDYMAPLPTKEYDFFLNDDPASQSIKLKNYLDFTKYGGGVFPITLFDSKSSYEFQPENYESSNNYKEEVNALTKKIFDFGADIYIRDNSFLGFPSYNIYIPGFSPLGQKATINLAPGIQLDIMIKRDKFEDVLFPFEEIDSQKILNVLSIIDEYKSKDKEEKDTPVLMKTILNLEFENNFYWDTIPVSYFLVILSIREKNYDAAQRFLDQFLKETGLTEDKYYMAVKIYLELKLKGLKTRKIVMELGFKGFEASLINDIINDLNEENVMNGIDLPSCPDCEKCPISNYCLTSKRFKKTVTINKEMFNNNIKQESISEVFKK